MKLAAKITVGLLASLSVTVAMAQTAPVKPAPHPHSVHHQGPGPGHKDVTRAEVLAKASERFDRIDTNKDGVLTRQEQYAQRKKMRDHRVARPHHPEHPLARNLVDHKRPPPPGDHKGPPPPPPGGPGPGPNGPAPQR